MQTPQTRKHGQGTATHLCRGRRRPCTFCRPAQRAVSQSSPSKEEEPSTCHLEAERVAQPGQLPLEWRRRRCHLSLGVAEGEGEGEGRGGEGRGGVVGESRSPADGRCNIQCPVITEGGFVGSSRIPTVGAKERKVGPAVCFVRKPQ